MKRRLIGLLFACSLVCVGVAQAEVLQVDENFEHDARGASSPFNQVIKQLNRVVCNKVDAVQEKVCDILDTTTLIVVPKLCDTLMTVTNIELLTTTTIIPKLCDVQDTVTTIENTIDTSLLPKVCSMLMSVTNIELLTTTTVVPKLCNLDAMTTTTIIPKLCTILDTVTTSCSRTVITTAPFTIEEPGSYCLAANLAGTLTISASNVTLDLNGYSIDSGVSDALLIDSTSTTTGIVIKNGLLFTTARGITRTGSELISNLSIEGLTITADTGIYLDSGIKNLLIDNCVITADYAGIFLGADSSLVSNCVVSLSTLGGTRGFFILPDCKNAKFVNCLVEGGLIGFDGSSSDGPLVFDHCVTYSSRSVGFSFNGDVKGVELLQCSAMYGQGDGFLLDNFATDFVFRDCSSMKNKDGFVFSEGVSNVVLSGCVALGNIDDGFLLDDSTVMNLVFHACEADHNGGNGFDLSAGTGAGHRVQECRSMTNTGTGFSDATPANAIYVSNFASGNAFEFTPSIPDIVTSAGAATSYWENVAI